MFLKRKEDKSTQIVNYASQFSLHKNAIIFNISSTQKALQKLIAALDAFIGIVK